MAECIPGKIRAEIEVLIDQGLNNSEIGRILGISRRTVGRHREGMKEDKQWKCSRPRQPEQTKVIDEMMRGWR